MNAPTKHTLLAVLLALSAVAGSSHAAETILTTSDSKFLEQAAQSGIAEIEASKLAETHTANPKVKAFAATMVADHKALGDELKKLADSKQVKISGKPTPTQNVELKLLGHHEGDKFDESYSRSFGVKLHQNTILLFRNAVAHVKDADIKAFAEKSLPGLEHHLEMAEMLTR